MFGEVPEPVGVMWHNREVLNFTFGVGRKTQKLGPVRREPEVVRPHGGGQPGRLQLLPGPRLLQRPQRETGRGQAREVPRWRESEVFTPLERDVMEYAEAMTHTPPTVTDDMAAGCWRPSARPRWWS